MQIQYIIMKNEVDVEDQSNDQEGLIAKLGDSKDDDKDVKNVK